MQQEAREQYLIKLFKMDGRPYVMRWDYRKGYTTYKEDYPVLKQMEAKGDVKMIEKTNKSVTWQYIAEDGAVPGKPVRVGEGLEPLN